MGPKNGCLAGGGRGLLGLPAGGFSTPLVGGAGVALGSVSGKALLCSWRRTFPPPCKGPTTPLFVPFLHSSVFQGDPLGCHNSRMPLNSLMIDFINQVIFCIDERKQQIIFSSCLSFIIRAREVKFGCSPTARGWQSLGRTPVPWPPCSAEADRHCIVFHIVARSGALARGETQFRQRGITVKMT